MKTPKKVKQAGLKKWREGVRRADGNIREIEEWWREFGITTCSFCKEYDSSRICAQVSSNSCPLKGNGTCHDAWNLIDKAAKSLWYEEDGLTLEAFALIFAHQAPIMLAAIEAVETDD